MRDDYNLMVKHCPDLGRASEKSAVGFVMVSLSYNVAVHIYSLMVGEVMRPDVFAEVLKGIDSGILGLKSGESNENSWRPGSIKYFHSHIRRYLDLILESVGGSLDETELKSVGVAVVGDIFEHYGMDGEENAYNKFLLVNVIDAQWVAICEYYAENSRVSLL